MICSNLSTISVENVAKMSGDAILWFQLYVYKDRQVTRDLIERAVKSGYKAIILTADAPIGGKRRADERNAFQLPSHLKFANFENHSKELTVMPQVETGASGMWTYASKLIDQSISWEDLEWLVEVSPLPIIVKGVMRADDTSKAIQFGASGVIVSNHGGRQLDYAAGGAAGGRQGRRRKNSGLRGRRCQERKRTTFSRRSRSALKRSSWAARCSGDSPLRAAKESATFSTSSNSSLSIQ
ncbi:hypothetical protein L596_027569 [Steinernema carpocapsae]|uniref:FMN hydroxy acid dehydrogenase domain-containing protein n=1 Tax=Steinernema carpocapsae TaxID=34508 RepID=A0A4U5LVV7_STECR|nr:hypothetical protein L596_027569 [Steinernema carpocapsae]